MSPTIQRARYRLRLWPGLSRWGATDEEVAGPYPGAELVPEGKRSPTMAVTINATPEQVWPWLVQMGWGRGGWYSWDLLDNAGRRSATEVHPEWQNLAVGDQSKFWAWGASRTRTGSRSSNRTDSWASTAIPTCEAAGSTQSSHGRLLHGGTVGLPPQRAS